MKQIAYSKSALKTLRRIPANVAATIKGKIEQYAADPASLSANVTKLQGRESYRLRVGDRRVIFDEDGNVLAILEIGPRGGIYG
ncbi:type II toxin-antitoxin system RelE family toxin [Microvirga lotononidis]|uniref:Cytotoxic translational repressor of toxin-antitoxin stability system n=1 Tax=Microvirga lotononidis TaxID=864069 RepID=I4Z0Q7_9HYPH|nr:type II toxin-antitoxin system RelE/ParE family toxin [Microvirga lotononidis]EIM29799.1 cytotoxic translational repressor of toxin-antitoxin stability system [Microvirga lotononidis]WQO31110.1 type II toxin-antitoxin system RelE/ParE family toxin [Microvirga lotononidis]